MEKMEGTEEDFSEEEIEAEGSDSESDDRPI